jgi:hypothetical protein
LGVGAAWLLGWTFPNEDLTFVQALLVVLGFALGFLVDYLGDKRL